MPDQRASCGDGPTVRHLEIAAESEPQMHSREDIIADPDRALYKIKSKAGMAGGRPTPVS